MISFALSKDGVICSVQLGATQVMRCVREISRRDNRRTIAPLLLRRGVRAILTPGATATSPAFKLTLCAKALSLRECLNMDSK